MDREAIYHKLKEYKHNITTRTEGISGITNYVIELYHQDPQVPQALLYVIDSRLLQDRVDLRLRLDQKRPSGMVRA